MTVDNSTRKKVLMIAYVFPPIAYAGTYRTLRFCRYLPHNGWLPLVLTIREADDLDNEPSLIQQLSSDVPIYRTHTVDFWRMWNKYGAPLKKTRKVEGATASHSHIYRSSMYKHWRNLKAFVWELLTIPDHMVFWIPFAVVRGLLLYVSEGFDVIYTSTPPHSAQVSGLLLARLCRVPWVADFRDPWVGNFTDQQCSQLRLHANQLLEKKVIQNADKVLIASGYYREVLSARYPDVNDKIEVLPNGFDSESYASVVPTRYEKFTILYSGSFYGDMKPDFFLKGMAKWLDTMDIEDRVQTQVLFYGNYPEQLMDVIRLYGLESIVHVNGRISQEEVIANQKGADVLLLVLGFNDSFKGVIPSKIFEYMAAGRPILAIIPDGEAADIMRDYEQLWRVRSNDMIDLCNFLDRAYLKYKANMRCTHSANIQMNSDNRFDARVQTRELADLFDKVIHS